MYFILYTPRSISGFQTAVMLDGVAEGVADGVALGVADGVADRSRIGGTDLVQSAISRDAGGKNLHPGQGRPVLGRYIRLGHGGSPGVGGVRG